MDEPIDPPGLLVSVRSLAEAQIVAPLPIAVLDLKEPSAGALAPTDEQVWQQVAEAFAGQVRLSVALGDFPQALQLAARVPAEFTFAKAGPADCQSVGDLQQAWRDVSQRLSASTELVAVAYADYQAADCLPPLDILRAAANVGIRWWLIDTFAKQGSTTLDLVNESAWLQINSLACEHDASWTLAGSMRINALPRLDYLNLKPDLIGVRGDVCDLSREGHISRKKVEAWLQRLRTYSKCSHYKCD